MSRRVSSPVFVGRGAELARLATIVEESHAGVSQTVLLGGDAGIGKTRLVSEIASRARAGGACVLVGGCLQLGEAGLPFAPFVEAFRALVRDLGPDDLERIVGPGRGELARLIPEILRSAVAAPLVMAEPSPVAQARLFELILGMIARLGVNAPVLLVLEDLHWADASSRDLLRFLVRNGRGLPLAIVATYRTDDLHRRHPLRPFLAEMSRMEDVERLELRPLERDSLAILLEAILGSAPDSGVVDRILERSEGNPFFAEELVASMVGGEGRGIPDTLRDLLLARIATLEGSTLALVRAAAVAGRRVEEPFLQAATTLPGGAFDNAIADAVARNVLVPVVLDGRGGYVFRHALIREAVEDDLLPGERTRLHLNLASILERQPGLAACEPTEEAAELAHHLYAGHDLERALPALVAAGDAAAAVYAYAEASLQYERALEIWRRVAFVVTAEIDHVALLDRAARTTWLAGDPDRAAALVRVALEEVDPDRDPPRAGELHFWLGQYFWGEGGAARDAEWETALGILPASSGRLRAILLASKASALSIRGYSDEAEPIATDAIAMAGQVGDPSAEALASRAMVHILQARSDHFGAIRLGREALRQARAGEDPWIVVWATGSLCWTLNDAGLHGEVDDIYLPTRGLIQRLGLDRRLNVDWYPIDARHATGRWAEARLIIEEGLARATSPDDRSGLVFWRARLALAEGRLEDARRDVAATGADRERGIGSAELLTNEIADIGLALLERRWVDARGLASATIDRFPNRESEPELRPLCLLGMRAEAELAMDARLRRDEVALAACVGNAGRLRETLRRVLGAAGESPDGPALTTLADAATGEAEYSRVDGPSDPVLWAEAVEANARLDHPYELAWARFRLAEALLLSGGRGARVAAAAPLREAARAAGELGAEPLRREVEALARRARIELGDPAALARGGPPAPDVSAGLTAREFEVLDYVAEGWTNRRIGQALFISEKTASVHVSNIIGKLGAANRAEAALIALRSGLLRTRDPEA